MPDNGRTDDPACYDVVGIGFGPANLALAVALREQTGDPALRSVFLERNRAFSWHRGLLLDDAMMQVSFLKDLATLRNPASRFSFVCYLHERGRLVDFINHKSLYPSRLEYHDYLSWAAGQLAGEVRYGREVVTIRPAGDGADVRFWDVVTAGPEPVTYRARNVVIGTGIRPALPDGLPRSDRIWHSSELLPRLAAWTAGPGQSFAVVGAGQSAAEVTAYLHRVFPTARVHAIMSRYGYSPADDSPFANRVFDPAAVDDFFQAPADVQQRFYDYHANTNYSVVDAELIQELYRRHYQERVTGRERLSLVTLSTVPSVKATQDGVRLTVQGPGAMSDLDVDAVVFATGYRPMDAAGLLGDAVALCERNEHGGLRLERDYRVTTVPDVRAGIYLQGGTEHTHGLSASLLSNVAVRAGEIVASLRDRRTAAAIDLEA